MDHQRGSVRQSPGYVILYTCFSRLDAEYASFSTDSSESATGTGRLLRTDGPGFLFLIRRGKGVPERAPDKM